VSLNPQRLKSELLGKFIRPYLCGFFAGVSPEEFAAMIRDGFNPALILKDLNLSPAVKDIVRTLLRDKDFIQECLKVVRTEAPKHYEVLKENQEWVKERLNEARKILQSR